MMESPLPEIAIREIVRHWSSLPSVADFAQQRHGFTDTNGGFGVTYPNDLDDYDRLTEGIVIPVGQVLLLGYWGPPDGYQLLVTERLFLDVLSDMLDEAGLTNEATQVRSVNPPAQ